MSKCIQSQDCDGVENEGIIAEYKARRIIQGSTDPALRVCVANQKAEFDHTILCEFDGTGTATGRNVVAVISYGTSGIPVTTYYVIGTGEEWVLPGEGYTLAACASSSTSFDVEMKEMCDRINPNPNGMPAISFLRWFVFENGVLTGTYYDTDQNGQPAIRNAVLAKPNPYEYNEVTIYDEHQFITFTGINSNFYFFDGTNLFINIQLGIVTIQTINNVTYPNLSVGDYTVVSYSLNGVQIPYVNNEATFGSCSESAVKTFIPHLFEVNGNVETGIYSFVSPSSASITITVISGSVTFASAGSGNVVLPEGSSFTWGNLGDGIYMTLDSDITLTGDSASCRYIVQEEEVI